jgi:hypothetical protein
MSGALRLVPVSTDPHGRPGRVLIQRQHAVACQLQVAIRVLDSAVRARAGCCAGRDQQVEAILIEAIEAEMPQNDPAPRAAAYAFFSRALPPRAGLLRIAASPRERRKSLQTVDPRGNVFNELSGLPVGTDLAPPSALFRQRSIHMRGK